MIHQYTNGNYIVRINDVNGTKERITIDPDAQQFLAEYPESMDIKLSDRCLQGCEWCHEDSKPDGNIATLFPLPQFFKTLKPYSECALGGGDLFEIKDLEDFLIALKGLNLIPSITVSQRSFMKNAGDIAKWAAKKYVYGIGVSLENPNEEFIDMVKRFPNAVIHVINGVVKINDLEKLFNKNLKLLILGYKMFRRGKDYYNSETTLNQIYLKSQLKSIMPRFKVISFDNLALWQLKVRSQIHRKLWKEIYMGDDGQHTFYIDLVKREYGLNSTSVERFPLEDDAKKMFKHVKELSTLSREAA